MVSLTTPAAIFAACLIASAAAQSSKPAPIPTPTAEPVNMGVKTPKGCFKSSTPLEDYGSGQYQTADTCQQICVLLGKAVFAVSAGSNCWCGDLLPAADDQVDDGECDSKCNGFGELGVGDCGGIGRFSVFYSGVDNNAQAPGNYETGASSTPTPTPTSNSPTSQQPQSTAVVIQTEVAPPSQTSAPAEEDEKGGSNVGAIVGGVVAVVAVALIAVGAWFFMKRRKDQRAEQSRRSAAMRDFYGKPPGTGASSIADNRLDPVMMHRRNSNGSIADNEDYSRRVLAVTNA